jgi:pyridoxal 5'-phosphate synthase pdxS subunit
MMQLGAESVFVGSGIFKSADPKPRAEAIVQAVTYHDDPRKLLEISLDLGEAMPGLELKAIPEDQRLAVRGW